MKCVTVEYLTLLSYRVLFRRQGKRAAERRVFPYQSIKCRKSSGRIGYYGTQLFYPGTSHRTWHEYHHFLYISCPPSWEDGGFEIRHRPLRWKSRSLIETRCWCLGNSLSVTFSACPFPHRLLFGYNVLIISTIRKLLGMIECAVLCRYIPAYLPSDSLAFHCRQVTLKFHCRQDIVVTSYRLTRLQL